MNSREKRTIGFAVPLALYCAYLTAGPACDSASRWAQQRLIIHKTREKAMQTAKIAVIPYLPLASEPCEPGSILGYDWIPFSGSISYKCGDVPVTCYRARSMNDFECFTPERYDLVPDNPFKLRPKMIRRDNWRSFTREFDRRKKAGEF